MTGRARARVVDRRWAGDRLRIASGRSTGAGIALGLTGGAADDRSGATSGAGIGLGLSNGGAGDRSVATNGSGVGLGLTGGAANDRSGATNGAGVGGGTATAGDQSSTSVGSANSITLSRPANTVDGDFLLAVVTAQGANVSSATDVVCAPGRVDAWSTNGSRRPVRRPVCSRPFYRSLRRGRRRPISSACRARARRNDENRSRVLRDRPPLHGCRPTTPIDAATGDDRKQHYAVGADGDRHQRQRSDRSDLRNRVDHA